MSRVQIEEPRPKIELFACSSASSKFFTRTIGSAGPKTSSCSIREAWIDIGDQRRLQVKSFIVIVAFQLLTAEQEFAAPLKSVFDLFLHLLTSLGRMQRTHQYAGFKAVSDVIFFAFSTSFSMNGSAILSKR